MNTKCLEDLAAYTLGVLDAGEQEQAAQHLTKCLHCQDEAAQVAEALHTTLGQAVVPAQPSPLVRTQLLARLALEMGPEQARTAPARLATPVAPALVIQESQRASVAPRSPQPFWRSRWIGAAAAVPTVLALLFGVMALNMKHQIDDVHTHILAEALLNTPHWIMPLGGQATQRGMQGEIILPKQGTASLLILAGVPTPAHGMDYRCWVHVHGRWMPSGRLRPDANGMAMMVFDRNLDLHYADDMGITLEAQAQATALPATPMLLSTRL